MKPTIKIAELTIVRKITDQELALHLDTCLRPSDPGLLAGTLGHIAGLRGFSQLSRDTGIRRTTLYRILSIHADPSFSDMLKVVAALGFKLHFEAIAVEPAWVGESVTRAN
jgi:probable addiction module antidote protein